MTAAGGHGGILAGPTIWLVSSHRALGGDSGLVTERQSWLDLALQPQAVARALARVVAGQQREQGFAHRPGQLVLCPGHIEG